MSCKIGCWTCGSVSLIVGLCVFMYWCEYLMKLEAIFSVILKYTTLWSPKTFGKSAKADHRSVRQALVTNRKIRRVANILKPHHLHLSIKLSVAVHMQTTLGISRHIDTAWKRPSIDGNWNIHWGNPKKKTPQALRNL